MSEVTNLIYNGDFSKGTESWSGSNISVSNGVLSLKGDLVQNINYAVPVANGRRYRLTFDLKFTTKTSSSFYIALIPFDNNKSSINIAHTNRAVRVSSTLASPVANGDTSVTITDATGWPTARTYQRVGICNKLAWGLERCTYSQSYSSISGNVITLKSAWAGGSFPAGTAVAEFEDSSTYYYPWSSSSANLPTEWKTYTVEFNGGNSIRYSCQYFQFSTLGYQHEYSMRNIKIECISDYQECPKYNYGITPRINKSGIIEMGNYLECGVYARYIRDSITGNTVNSNNHWCEFDVINSVGENIALGKNIKINETTYSNSVVTDGKIDSSYLPNGVGGTAVALIDLGYVENLSKIKIWHYYPDGRTYNNNVTEVSIDGVNWLTVYKGKKPETSSGNEIILSPLYGSIHKDGRGYFNEFIEY